ncbi:hypothetical protein ACWGKW_42190 [Streptomyces sp. NPDC054766]
MNLNPFRQAAADTLPAAACGAKDARVALAPGNPSATKTPRGPRPSGRGPRSCIATKSDTGIRHFARSGRLARQPRAYGPAPEAAAQYHTLDWVDGYLPAQIGPDRYTAHITVGFATLDDLQTIEAEPSDAFTVRPAAVAVYQLGNSGAARKLLQTWPTPN